MQYNSNILNSTYQRENQETKPQRKKFEDLTLMDSFLFDAATEKPENAAIIAKVIIERTTKRKVKKLVVETQKELKGININKHGIRMDVYTVKNIVTENNQLVYNDGVTKIFLYTKGTKGGSKELKELLTFLENPIYDNAMDEELLQILNIVDSIKRNSK